MKNKTLFLLLILTITSFSCKKQESTDDSSLNKTPIDTISKSQTESISDSSEAYTNQTLKTKTGKTIKVKVEMKDASLTSIAVLPVDFEFSHEPFIVEDSDPLTNLFVSDLDGNGFDEFYLVTTSVGSGSYGNIYGFASNQDKSLTPIYVPQITEKDLDVGSMFQGYMGHDSIYLDQGKLVRKFPVYLEGDPNCCPTGGKRHLQYHLVAGEAGWVLKAEIDPDNQDNDN